MVIHRSIRIIGAVVAALAATASFAHASERGVHAAPPGPSASIAPESAPSATPALRAAAQRGDAQAQFDLATAIACGRGARRDLAAAARWFGAAAEQGHVAAKSVLGWMHMSGAGAARDAARARALLADAAQQGDAAAQNNLGVMHARGIGGPVDKAAAEAWFRRAAAQGALDAARNLESLLDGRRRTASPTPALPRIRT